MRTLSPPLVSLMCIRGGIYFNASCTAISSATLVSSKRSAGAAGMDTSGVASGSKRRRVEETIVKNTTSELAVQNGIYAAEKFSDPFAISHVLNLLVESEYVARVCCSAK